MSHFDIDKLPPREVIAQFVLEQKNKGLVLPYSDYLIIDEWLSAAQNKTDFLLLTLEGLLPEYFTKDGKPTPRSLSGLNRRVLKAIKENNFRS